MGKRCSRCTGEICWIVDRKTCLCVIFLVRKSDSSPLFRNINPGDEDKIAEIDVPPKVISDEGQLVFIILVHVF